MIQHFSAAHCVRHEGKDLGTKDLLIVLGKLNIQDWAGGERLYPESIHIHPDYQSFSSDADIAVLKLSTSLQFTKFVRPICLWMNEPNELNNVVGE